MTIEYTLTPVDPAAHLFEVTLIVDEPDPGGQKLTLPVWIPGSYMIRDFARHIVGISAKDGAGDVQLVKLDKTTWQAPAGLNSLTVTCQIYAWDLSVRAAHLDQSHGFFNGTSVFLKVEGQADQPCTMLLKRPHDSKLQDWHVATAMQAVTVDSQGFGEYRADNYDELIDHPVEMGTFERVTFVACGVPHELVLTGQYRTDTVRICEDLTRICEAQIRFFGEPAPVERYVFLVMVVGQGYGGLEHRASTSLLITRENLPVPGDENISDAYLDFLGLCSHEYFHTWNVKRIKPAVLDNADLTREVHTPLLWAFEGITSYYDDLFLYRCGLIDKTRYLKLLAKAVTRVQRGAGRKHQSVAESSFDAWTRFYKQDENAPNAIVSYYTKGSLVAMCIDLLIRQKSAGRYSLDTVMQKLWADWLATGTGIGDDQIQSLAEKLVEEDLSSFFDQAVRGTDDLSLEELLATVDVQLSWRPSEGVSDEGGTPARKKTPLLWLGIRWRDEPAGMKITHVLDDSPARKAGWSAGDTLVALYHLKVSGKSLEKQLARHKPGDTLVAHLFRRDELLELPVVPELPPLDTCYLESQSGDSDKPVNSWPHPVPASDRVGEQA